MHSGTQMRILFEFFLTDWFMSLLNIGHPASSKVFVIQQSFLAFLKPYEHFTVCSAPA